MSEAAKQIAYTMAGTIFGDSYYNPKTGYLRSVHTNKQRDLVKYKERLYRSFGIYLSSRYDYVKHTNFGDYLYSEVCAKLTNPMRRHFDKFERLFTGSGKQPSEYLLNRITPHGLLLWYLDDGNLLVKRRQGVPYGRSMRLATHSFSEERCQLIVKMLSKRFSMNAVVGRDKGYPVILIGAESAQVFIDLVRPMLSAIPESMLYKFDMAYAETDRPDRKHLSTLYNLGTKYAVMLAAEARGLQLTGA